jgi:hypothetical protein
MRAARGASASVSNPYISAALAPSMARVSSTGMSQKASRSHWRVWGHVPSGWGKSLPHMRLPTPISYRRASSRRRVFEAPMPHWVSNTSLGRRDRWAVSWSPSLRDPCSRSNAVSIIHSRSAAQNAPHSVTTNRSPG